MVNPKDEYSPAWFCGDRILFRHTQLPAAINTLGLGDFVYSKKWTTLVISMQISYKTFAEKLNCEYCIKLTKQGANLFTFILKSSIESLIESSSKNLKSPKNLFNEFWILLWNLQGICVEKRIQEHCKIIQRQSA